MAKSKAKGKRSNRDQELFDSSRERQESGGAGEARRFLKHLDRRLQRFTSSIDALEERANRLTDDEQADLILAVESLHRETLMLRSEIREHLAAGNRSLGEMAAYLEESWEQLKDSFDEIKENLLPEERLPKTSAPKVVVKEEPDEEEWFWDDEEWGGSDDEWTAGEIHPPRIGPKR